MKADLELYRVLVAVAQEGSFSKGARRLYITQPAASQAVGKLERQLGVSLFIRGSRGVTLTPEGELLYGHASQALDMLKTGEEKLATRKKLQAGVLNIGAADTITKEFLLPYIRAFHEKYPAVSLRVTNRTSLQMKELVRRGALDLAVVNLPLEEPDLVTLPVLRVQDIFVAGPGFEKLREKPQTLEAIAGLPLVMLEREANSRRYVEEFFIKNGIVLKPEIELGAHELLAGFAAIGLGAACVVRQFCTRPLREKKVFSIPMKTPIPARCVGACYRAGIPLTGEAEEFLRFLKEARYENGPDT
ncbi:MAG: LysR family transcriptional regulator [Oscillospiraceae bacterium]|nr:LysR family transcriptional regulator [Oscillospiraceae bacterium]